MHLVFMVLPKTVSDTEVLMLAPVHGNWGTSQLSQAAFRVKHWPHSSAQSSAKGMRYENDTMKMAGQFIGMIFKRDCNHAFTQ